MTIAHARRGAAAALNLLLGQLGTVTHDTDGELLARAAAIADHWAATHAPAEQRAA